MGQRPNIIMILTDDQGYGDMGCHGNPWIKTPEMDRLNEESVRFTDFHVDAMCAPTRAALMTGRYSARTGVWSTLKGRYIMHREETTIAELFANAGYRTGLFGKWHLGDSWPYRAFDRGFHDVLSFGGGVVGEIPDYWDNDYFNAVYERNGVKEQFSDRYCTDVWFDEALSFIEKSKDDPFFCYIPTNAPHDPFYVDSKYSDQYLEMGVPYERARFYGMISCIDENLGRLRSRLDELNLADNTIIIYMGDNGTSGGVDVDEDSGFMVSGYNAGMRGKKGWSFEGGHRNSCIVHWPNGELTGGRDINALCAHIDLFPTLTSLCGIDTSHLDLDGRDITTLLTGKENDHNDDRVICMHNQQRENPVKYKDCEVMTHRWRLAKAGVGGPEEFELFDVLEDHGQVSDKTIDEKAVADQLLNEYEKWWNHISERFDDYSPIYIGGPENPVVFTCHAWHGEVGLYNQWHVRPGIVDNGWWPVEVVTPGLYEFELRRWPEETDVAIRAGMPARRNVPFVDDFDEGIAIPVKTARITIGHFDEVLDVADGDVCKTFRTQLPAGSHKLQTCFTDEDGVERGAYYVYVRKIDVK